MNWKCWKYKYWNTRKDIQKSNSMVKPICPEDEWKLALVEEYIKLYKLLGYVGYKYEMEISEIHARIDVFKKINIFSILTALVTLFTAIIDIKIIEMLNYKNILVYLVYFVSVVMIFLSLLIVFTSNPFVKWWGRIYILAAMCYSIIIWIMDFNTQVSELISGIFSIIIILLIVAGYVDYLSTKYRARLIALNYIKKN